MSATLSPPIKLSPYLWRYTWTGTAPFRVFDYFQYKYLKTSTTDTQIDILSYYENQPPPIQVLDSTEGSLDGEIYPGKVRVQWRGQANAAYYQVRLSGLAILNYTHESGRGYYEYNFAYPYLSSLNTVAVEVVAFDSEDNYKSYNIPVMSAISVPVMQAMEISYDSGTTTLTMSAI